MATNHIKAHEEPLAIGDTFAIAKITPEPSAEPSAEPRAEPSAEEETGPGTVGDHQTITLEYCASLFAEGTAPFAGQGHKSAASQLACLLDKSLGLMKELAEQHESPDLLCQATNKLQRAHTLLKRWEKECR
jgi:hypothetical protein